MNQEHLNQSLMLTAANLAEHLANEIVAKNLLEVQITEIKQTNQILTNKNIELEKRISELETLLEQQTAPSNEEGGK